MGFLKKFLLIVKSIVLSILKILLLVTNTHINTRWSMEEEAKTSTLNKAELMFLLDFNSQLIDFLNIELKVQDNIEV